MADEEAVMGCAHDSTKIIMQRQLDHDSLGGSFFRVVDIEEDCNLCDAVLYRATDDQLINYLQKLVELQGQ